MTTAFDLTRTPLTPALLAGAVEIEETGEGLRPHRLPARARAQNTDPQLAMAEGQPAGVRLAFRTAARTVELDARPTKRHYVGAPPRPDGSYDLHVDGRFVARGSIAGGDVLRIDMTAGTFAREPGDVGTLRFAGLAAGEKDIEIWLPHDEAAELVALRADASVAPLPDRGRRRWLHHGSSISHGSNAAAPSLTWPVLAAGYGGVELTNLGFGGGALLDPFTARALRDLPADLISLKLGINLANSDVMRLRGFTPAVHGFLDSIRAGHPGTPLLVISAIHCPIHEDTPGPAAPEFDSGTVRFVATGDPTERAQGKLTLNVIRDELARIVAQRAESDPQLHYLDGRELYGPADYAELPLPDELHPDPATHRRMGERFADLALQGGGPLSGR